MRSAQPITSSIDHESGPEARPAVLPPGPHLPSAIQGFGFMTRRRQTVAALARRHGSAFTIRIPVFGRVVVIADPTMAKQLFTTPTDQVNNVRPSLGRILGDGSMFALEGTDHRRRRKLLTPPLHGKRIKQYEAVVAEEFEAEARTWPTGTPFATLEPMMRVTLNVILRTVFGADGRELNTLRDIIPPMVTAGSRLAALPDIPFSLGRLDPRRAFRAHRRTYESTIDTLITKARNDPRLDERDDILALMLQSRYDDGSAMTDAEVADELLALLAAGHETTATTLAWAVERLQRNPDVLDALTTEVDAGGNELRLATIMETQRSRPVIDFAGRHVVADSIELGPYRIPRGYNILVAISQLHDDSRQFRDPERFDPGRFLGTTPGPAWLPFGGGTRRCIGAAFAHMEMDVVLRILLRDFTIEPTSAKPEAWHSRGVAYAPRRGGMVTVHRRTPTTTATDPTG
ncbi:cytochrome P450 [Gordonia insulae]|uniref:Cytochrome P450 138 n=1 Tax=Gordonia insulae TaxID=2420509 RepID=A0A3G8JU65_9ACTN|nr:cytochrome P450 [Gordonia insulae]AZG48701.1 Putative cytochrome P450 138 [Gordonia insulae]